MIGERTSEDCQTPVLEGQGFIDAAAVRVVISSDNQHDSCRRLPPARRTRSLPVCRAPAHRRWACAATRVCMQGERNGGECVVRGAPPRAWVGRRVRSSSAEQLVTCARAQRNRRSTWTCARFFVGRELCTPASVKGANAGRPSRIADTCRHLTFCRNIYILRA